MGVASFLGWCTAAAVLSTLMNFVLKQVSRDYVKAISARRPSFASAYRNLVRLVVRTHPVFGFAALAAALAHVSYALFHGIVSLTGAATLVLLCACVSLGAFGRYVVQRPRGWWIHLHRAAALLASLGLVLHVPLKAFV